MAIVRQGGRATVIGRVIGKAPIPGNYDIVTVQVMRNGEAADAFRFLTDNDEFDKGDLVKISIKRTS